MFQGQWHDEIDDAYIYEMTCNFVEAKHLGCYTGAGANLHPQDVSRVGVLWVLLKGYLSLHPQDVSRVAVLWVLLNGYLLHSYHT